ncbi:hypothetical protein QJQ45_012677 [Haematococcus lacustris]|nr:hypothetical protein QJQ45_012677 [Haematococcus lacustris]
MAGDTDQLRGRVVLVDEHRTTRVSSAVNGQEPCEEELDHEQPTRRADWKPQAGQCIGESKWRPLELCYWPEQGALPAKGKEYPEHGCGGALPLASEAMPAQASADTPQLLTIDCSSAVTPPQDHVLDDDTWLAMCQAAFCQLSPSQDFQFSISQRPNVTRVSLSFAWTHEGVADGEVEKLSIRVPLLPVPDNGEAMRGILSRICYDYCQLLGSVQGLQASCSAQAALLQDRDREVEQLTTSSKARDRELFTKAGASVPLLHLLALNAST